MKRENYTPFILGAIVLVAAFFRLYDVPNRALMGNETVRDAVVGLVGARELQLPVTGPFSSLGAFTFGPWYWYHLIASYWIFPTPYAAWYMLAFMSLLFVVVLFGIGLVIGGPILGLVAAFLAAIAPNQLTAATHLTQPNLLFFYTAFIFFLVVLTAKSTHPSRWVFTMLGAAFGIAVNFHFQAVNLGVAVVALFVFRKSLRFIWHLLLGFFIVNIPLLVFQLLNHWHTLRMVVYTMVHMDGLIYVPNSWKIYVFQFWPDLWANQFGLPIWVGVVFGAVASAVILRMIMKKQQVLMRLSVLIFFVMFVALRYYKGERFFSYYNFFTPWLFVFAAVPLAWGLQAKHIAVRLVTIGVLLAYTMSVLPKDIAMLAPSEFTLALKNAVAIIKAEYEGKSVVIHNCLAKNLYRDFTLTFLLGIEGRVGTDGAKLGFTKGGCEYPGSAAGLLESSKYASEELQKMELMDFTAAPEAAILENHWFPLTLEVMYDTEVKWWYKEKP